MSRNKRVLTPAGVSLETLEQTPARVLTFLMAVASLPVVRALLVARGYDAAEHRRGWTLLERAGNRAFEVGPTDETITAAVVELDAWDETGIRLIRAGLTRHPAQRASTLEGIEPATGPAAVLNVSKILDRLNALEDSTDGRAALETLARRGLDAAERRRLAALVKTAKIGTTDVPDAARLAADDDEHLQALLALREWFDEWAEITRLSVKRRDQLIRLGLAERRNGSTTDEDEPAPSPFIGTPVKPAPPAPPAA